VREEGNDVARTTQERVFRLVGRQASSLILVAVAGFGLDSYVTALDAQQASMAPRVRSENPLLAKALAEGKERSTTFRRLIEAIEATDGLVYVMEGKCGQGVRACLHMSVELSGPYRLLRILVTPGRATGCELLVSIGHELQHALEALSDPNVRTGFGLSSFFQRIGPEGPRRFETPEALQAGWAVAKEAC
jgi:hypothetical protein